MRTQKSGSGRLQPTGPQAADANAVVDTIPHTDDGSYPAVHPLPAQDRDIWSVREAAEYLGLSATTGYTLVRAGQMPGAFRIGRSWRVSRPALLKSVHG